MKKLNGIFIILSILLISNPTFAQKNSRFERFKKMKLNFILENTSLNNTETESFKIIFEESENKYHDEVWVLKRKLRKELKEAYDTITSESASKYINVYYQFEKLGNNIKHKRNQKLLKSIRPEVVLSILQQEKEFDEVMFKRIRNSSKEKQKEKEKE
jgi:DNA polymerase III delta prime subunit